MSFGPITKSALRSGPETVADLSLLPEETRPRFDTADLMIRVGLAIVFLIAGAEKFSATNPNSHWVSMFNQIGLGEWFRYFAAVVEVLGAALILIPRMVLMGIALLAITMVSAAVIVFLSSVNVEKAYSHY